DVGGAAGWGCRRRASRTMRTATKRTCTSCGNDFSVTAQSCPVCMLRKGLGGRVESGDSSFEEAVRVPPDQPPKQFEHYELVAGGDGETLAVGGGGRGGGYKGVGINICCPATL